MLLQKLETLKDQNFGLNLNTVIFKFKPTQVIACCVFVNIRSEVFKGYCLDIVYDDC